MFVVGGEALFDVFAGAPSADGLVLEARTGGSPFNVAIGLARLGQASAFFGAISRDAFGNRLMSALADEGVDTGAVRRTDAPTTLSVVGLDDRGVPTYFFHGDHGADRDLPVAALASIPAQARVFHFGSYSLLVEPVASTLRALVESQCKRSLVAYDPNVRLNVEPQLDRWREVVAWMAAHTHVLKASEEDLALLFPGVDLQTLAGKWLDQGAALIVVTRGGEGAVAWTRNARVERPAKKVVVVDTVGAGDTFQAAMLAWLSEHDRLHPRAPAALEAGDLAALLDFAVAAAAITCSRRGAQLPRRSELPS
ncbi:MAG TPA: carbohydrate kinase [Burkholderiales bacterium]|nr:carbohydrate kinase [Burkholderiales bacterium]